MLDLVGNLEDRFITMWLIIIAQTSEKACWVKN